MADTYHAIRTVVDNKGLKRGLKASRKDIQRYQNYVRADARRHAQTMKRTAGLVVAGITASTVAVINQAAEIQKLSKIANVSAEEFQTLAHVYGRYGVSADNVSESLKELSVKINDLRNDSSSMKEAFGDLGLGISDFGTNSAENLELVLDRLRNIEDPLRASAIASDILSTSGEELVAVFQAEKDEIDALKQRYESLNIAMGDEAVAKSQKLRSEMNLITDLVRNRYATGLLSGIESTEGYDDALQELGDTVESFGAAIPKVTKFLAENHKAVMVVVGSYATMSLATSRTVTNIIQLTAALGGGIVTHGLIGALGLAAKRMARFVKVGGPVIAAITALITVFDAYMEKSANVEAASEALDRNTETIESNKAAMQALQVELDSLQGRFMSGEIQTQSEFMDIQKRITSEMEARKLLQMELHEARKEETKAAKEQLETEKKVTKVVAQTAEEYEARFKANLREIKNLESLGELADRYANKITELMNAKEQTLAVTTQLDVTWQNLEWTMERIDQVMKGITDEQNKIANAAERHLKAVTESQRLQMLMADAESMKSLRRMEIQELVGNKYKSPSEIKAEDEAERAREEARRARDNRPISPESQQMKNMRAFRDAEAQSMMSLQRMQTQQMLGNFQLHSEKLAQRNAENAKRLAESYSQSLNQNLNNALMKGVIDGDWNSLEDLFKKQLINTLSKGLFGEGGLAGLLGAGSGGGGLFGFGGFLGLFHTGTDYVPRDGFAKLQKGEAVLSREENMEGGRGITNNIQVLGDLNEPTMNTIRNNQTDVATINLEYNRENRVS